MCISREPRSAQPTALPTALPTTIENKQCIMLLGIYFTSDLKWDTHVNNIRKQCHSRFYAILVLKSLLCRKDLLNVYSLLVRSLLEYCAPLFVALNVKNSNVLNSVQSRCHSLICGFGHSCNCLESLQSRQNRITINLFLKSASNADSTLHRIIPRKLKTKFSQPFSRSSQRLNSFILFNHTC